jgi:hypothetical protein
MKTATAPLHVELKKISPERAALSCRRADGSVTWSRVSAFFPAHDLTHYAVESTLGFRRGFFGLIAEGWHLADFTQLGVAERLPREALVVENIVCLVERISTDLPLTEFQAALDDVLIAHHLPPFQISLEGYERLAAARANLLLDWAAVPTGETLALDFVTED